MTNTSFRVLIFTGLFLSALSTTAHAQPLTPAQVSRDIRLHGAKSAVQKLDHSGRFDTVLNEIASGKTAWVRLAPALSEGTDAGNSMGLSVALAHALPANPAAVLAVLSDDSVMQASVVCGLPFIEPTPQEVTSYLSKAIPAVTHVHESPHLSKRAACLSALQQAQASSGQ